MSTRSTTGAHESFKETLYIRSWVRPTDENCRGFYYFGEGLGGVGAGTGPAEGAPAGGVCGDAELAPGVAGAGVTDDGADKGAGAGVTGGLPAALAAAFGGVAPGAALPEES